MTVSPTRLVQLTLTARVQAGRSTRFWGYVNHHQKDDDKTHHKAKDF